MHKIIVGAAFIAAALLAGCSGEKEGGRDGDGAYLCPGGANCPSDSTMDGFTLDAAYVLADAATAAFVSRAVQPTAPERPAAAASTDTQADPGRIGPSLLLNCHQTPLPAGCPPVGKVLICPGPGCVPGISGILWLTRPGETACRPVQGQPCQTGMQEQTYGWVCRRGGDCGAMPHH
jgi:hypothetical protein